MSVEITSGSATHIGGDVAGRDILKAQISLVVSNGLTAQAVEELKQTAGMLVEILSSYNLLPSDRPTINDAYTKARILGGKLLEYPAITRAERDLLHSAGRVISVGSRMGFKTRQESDEAVAELEQNYQAVLLACNLVLQQLLLGTTNQGDSEGSL